ncbi:MAG: hypothetical protein K1X88_11545 [Nannocystaceae bacterium]|nr:hypothetical protein [Nannocystaceae bacterium]
MSLAFDRSAAFAFDKPAGVACPALTREHACAVHDRRASLGMGGCIGYDCDGAGQRVVAMFGADAWRDGDAAAVLDAFARLRQVHALLRLLHAAQRLPLDAAARREHARLWAALDPGDGLDAAALRELPLATLDAEVHAFARSLRPLVSRARLPVVGAR